MGKIFDMTYKGLTSKIYKHVIQLNVPSPKKSFKKDQKTWIDIFSKRKWRWSTDSWNNAQHCESLGKCKSKSQWDITINYQNVCHQKDTNSRYWWGYEEKATLVHCVWRCKLVQSLWKTCKWALLSWLKENLILIPT